MDSLIVFNFDSQEIRFVDGQPVGVDVARVLGYKDPSSAVRDLVSSKNKSLGKLPGIRYGENKPRIEEIMLLKEAGIYQLIFGSKLPSAEKFQDWVFEEVLPSIRKTGQYSVQPTLSVNDIKRFAGIAGQLNKLPDGELKSVLQSQLMVNLTKSQSPKQTDEILLEKILAKTPHTGVTASELRRNIRAFRDIPTSEINDLIQVLVKSGSGYTKPHNKGFRFFRGQQPY